jgi:hypothetical protein
MTTDRYTKGVLSIIAVCLTIIIIKDISIIPQAKANSLNINKSIKTLDYGLVPLNPDGSITVKLSNSQALDVNIKNIDTYDELRVDVYSVSTTDELDVNLDEVGGGWISNGGPIKVKMEQ